MPEIVSERRWKTYSEFMKLAPVIVEHVVRCFTFRSLGELEHGIAICSTPDHRLQRVNGVDLELSSYEVDCDFRTKD